MSFKQRKLNIDRQFMCIARTKRENRVEATITSEKFGLLFADVSHAIQCQVTQHYQRYNLGSNRYSFISTILD